MTDAGAERAVRASVTRQAESCRRLGSPFTAALLDAAAARLDAGSAIGARVLAWPGDATADALALRFAGALHGLVLSGQAPALAALYPPAQAEIAALWPAVEAAMDQHAARLDQWLDSPPQTNEVGRASALILGLSHVAARLGPRLAVYEIGASAGLNLSLDRFSYAFGDLPWGGDSGVRLAPEMRGAVPPPIGDVEIIARAGCDIAPIDPADPAAAERLRAYCWPDQTARRQRLDAAIALAAAAGPKVVAADAAAWCDQVLNARPDGATGVVMHSVMWSYLPDPTKAAITETLDRLGREATADRPLARVMLEPLIEAPGATLRAEIWRGGGAGPEIADLAIADYHGAWIEWFAEPRPVAAR